MLWDKIRIVYYQLISKHIRISKGSHTPILYDDYDTTQYYYMINNNIELIYSIDEMYELMKLEKPIDPFTRIPIVDWCFVKVSISK